MQNLLMIYVHDLSNQEAVFASYVNVYISNRLYSNEPDIS